MVTRIVEYDSAISTGGETPAGAMRERDLEVNVGLHNKLLFSTRAV